jgi:hypothetical protein
MNDLIGTVMTEAIEARLFTNGQWQVIANGKPSVDAGLAFASLYGTLGDGPADGRPGALSLARAADDLGGTLEMTPAPPPDPDVVQ